MALLNSSCIPTAFSLNVHKVKRNGIILRGTERRISVLLHYLNYLERFMQAETASFIAVIFPTTGSSKSACSANLIF